MMDENKELNDEVNEGINEEVNELNEKNIDGVSGGRSNGEIFYAGSYAGDKKRKWEIIDKSTGNVVKRFKCKADAMNYALDNDRSTREIDWEEVCRRRDSAPKTPRVLFQRFSNWLDEDISGKYGNRYNDED